jgi:hypothetical protein
VAGGSSASEFWLESAAFGWAFSQPPPPDSRQGTTPLNKSCGGRSSRLTLRRIVGPIHVVDPMRTLMLIPLLDSERAQAQSEMPVPCSNKHGTPHTSLYMVSTYVLQHTTALLGVDIDNDS